MVGVLLHYVVGTKYMQAEKESYCEICKFIFFYKNFCILTQGYM